MEEDTWIPIILERPFLATARCCIDVKNGTLSFDVGNDHVEFNLLKATKFPSISSECNKIDAVDGLMQGNVFNLYSNDPLEHLMLNNSTTKYKNPEAAEYAQLEEASPPIPSSFAEVESLQDESKPSFDEPKVPR